MRIRILFLCLACTLSIAAETLYPKTVKEAHTDVYHGVQIEDPYHWLEDDRAPATERWVEAQNAVTFSFLESIDFRDSIKNRIRELYNYERYSAPVNEGRYQYYFKNDGLQNHAVVYRKRLDAEKAAPEVFLDPNTFSKDGTVGLTSLSFTKDGSLCAYAITEGGSDWRKIIVLDAESKKVVDGPLVDVKFSGLAWKGNDGFYYSSYDNPERKDGSQLSSKTQHHKLMYHTLGTPQSMDQLVYGGAKQPNRYIGGPGHRGPALPGGDRGSEYQRRSVLCEGPSGRRALRSGLGQLLFSMQPGDQRW